MALGARSAWLYACTALSASDLGLENELGGAEGAEADAVVVRYFELLTKNTGPFCHWASSSLALLPQIVSTTSTPFSSKRADNTTKEKGSENKRAAPGAQI
jgi:hypothetical protein